MLSHDQVEEIQDMDIDNPPSSRALDSRALPTLAANQVIKKKRKKRYHIREATAAELRQRSYGSLDASSGEESSIDNSPESPCVKSSQV